MDDARAEVIQAAPAMPAQEAPRAPTEPAFQEPVRPEAIAAAITPAFNKPAVGTPLKPSSHSVPAPAPALPATAVQAAPLRKKSAVERWAMMAGAAVVLLAAASALYLHLNGDNSSDLVALSLPPQEQAARGLDAGEAVVAPAAGVAGQGPAEALQANGANALPADAAPAAVPEGAPTAALQAPARQAEAVVNGTTYKLLIKPWGTVYVNGVDRGVSPPVKRLTLGQGEHTIRIVNPNFAEHVMTVNAGTAESATIEHDFTAQAEGDR